MSIRDIPTGELIEKRNAAAFELDPFLTAVKRHHEKHHRQLKGEQKQTL